MQVRTGRRLRNATGVRFAVCGRASGGSGFRRINRTLSLRRMVVIVEWTSVDAARAGRDLVDAAWLRTAEVWSASLIPVRTKGTFNGSAAFAGADEVSQTDLVDGDVVASLTYAEVRPTKMWRFYVRSFPKLARRATDPRSGMLAGVGFGDVPIRHACTFTLWPSSADVDRFAYGADDRHGPVQAQSLRDDWLSESLFARFRVESHRGTWSGRDPIA